MSAFRKMKLGAFLIMERLITEQQLKEALDQQLIVGGKLGTNLIEMGHITEAALGRALSKKYGIPSIDLSRRIQVHPEILKMINPQMAKKHEVFPLAIKDRRFILLMADPNDMAVLNDLEFSLGMPVRPVVASELTVTHLLEQFYGIKRAPRFVELEAKLQQEILEEARKSKERDERPADEKVIMLREVAPDVRRKIAPAAKPQAAPTAAPVPKPAPTPSRGGIDFSRSDGLSFDD